jgi:hypothetical protein
MVRGSARGRAVVGNFPRKPWKWRTAMKQVVLSDEVFEQLKNFIVDPFDENMETVICRLITITCKARDRWLNLPGSDTQATSEPQGELPLAQVDGPTVKPSFQSRRISEPSVM